ncbi:unnamed protein product [Prunus armeniaca]
MDFHGSFMEVTDITSSFLRSAAFRALGLVLHGIDTMELLDIIDYRLLCWRDAICEAITLGFHVDFLLNLVRNLACAVFGARIIHSMKLSQGSNEGISADNAECVTEAAARSSPRASSFFFLGILHNLKVVSSWLGDRLSWRVVLLETIGYMSL